MFGTEVPGVIHGWVANALEQRRMVPKPDATVMGHGLNYIQPALDTLRKGVSATKFVVTL